MRHLPLDLRLKLLSQGKVSSSFAIHAASVQTVLGNQVIDDFPSFNVGFFVFFEIELSISARTDVFRDSDSHHGWKTLET